ncbi:glycosyltransferase [Ornithinibacter aureus]|nr:glycosyltransferase [Ornithinibacter aureus]KAF0835425.1 glycosyltransferase involved in cell wall biosynthesis [Ornithinibacter aureus]
MSRRRPPGATRVAIASRLFPPESGAAAYRLGALARALTDRGVEVDVVTTRPPHGQVPSDAPGVRASRWPVLRDAGGNVRGYVQFASFDGPLLLRLLLRRRPDVVVVEPPPTTGTVVRLATTLRRVPYVYYAGDVSSTAAEGIGVPHAVVRVLRRVERFAMGGAVEVLAVSEGVAEEVRRLTRGRVPVPVVGTGVDTEVFAPVAPVAQAGDAIDASPPTVVYAGTMSEVHGASVFVEAFARVADEVPHARLVVFGQGTQEDELRALAARLVPGRVEFHGVVPGAVVARAMTTARAGLASLHPNVGYNYAFPTKMFAATACGAPVVYAGPGPGSAMVVEHRLGWACRWDVDEVAAALRSALVVPPTPEDRERLTAWTVAHASQRAVAATAADVVLRAAGA